MVLLRIKRLLPDIVHNCDACCIFLMALIRMYGSFRANTEFCLTIPSVIFKFWKCQVITNYSLITLPRMPSLTVCGLLQSYQIIGKCGTNLLNLPGIHGGFCESYTVTIINIITLTRSSPNLLHFSLRGTWMQIISANNYV